MATAAEVKVGRLLVRPNRDAQLEEAWVELREDRLVVKRRDFVHEDIMANYEMAEERTVLVERDATGLGVSIQGGCDFKSPVKVYRVVPNSRAAMTGQIHEGDVILDVNGSPLWGKTHEEAADVLKNAGTFVTLHVAKLQPREAEEPGPMETGPEQDLWLAFTEVPLQMASVTRYHKGTSVLKPNTIQVLPCDGRGRLSLHCEDEDSAQLNDWTTALCSTIRHLNKLEAERLNESLDRNEQIIDMGYVYEQLPSTPHTTVWQRKVLVLRRMQIQIFRAYPSSVEEWLRPEKSYKLLEVTLRVLKAHELSDQRANSIILASGMGENHIISFEHLPELSEWTRSIHNTTVGAVQHLEKQQFLGQWRGQRVYLCLDINRGFIIYDRSDLSQLWCKPFHQLRHSSDDGHASLRLEFTQPHSEQTMKEEVELEDLQIAVCVLESFLSARVASLDPGFILGTDLIAAQ